MIKVETTAKQNKIKEFIVAYRNKQLQLETEDTFVYSIVPMRLAVKYNVIISEFLLHDLLLRERKFYEPVNFISTKQQLIDSLTSVLEYEFSCENNYATLSDDAIKRLAKAHTRLTKKKKTAGND